MKRTLTFSLNGDQHGSAAYEALYTALRFGRSLQQSAPGRDVLRRERDVLRALQKIGEPDPAKTDDLRCPQCQRVVMTRDSKAYRLARDCELILSQAEIELLQERIDKGPWTGDAAMAMADALAFLGSAPGLP